MTHKEATVAGGGELKDGEMKQVSLGGTDILLARVKGKYHAVGAHSYAHQPLATLSNRELEGDLEQVTRLLEQITGSRPQAFSYPYGTPDTVDPRVAAEVGAAGYRIAFTMRREVNESLAEPLLLGRLDTNDLGSAGPVS